MLTTNAAAFLAVPNEKNDRVLIECKTILSDGKRCVLQFEALPAVAAGADVSLFAEVRGKFFQQAARVTVAPVVPADVADVASATQVEFELIGDAVSAEQRGSYRTAAVMLGIPVAVDRIAGCILADISPEGVGIIAPRPLTIGTMVDVALEIEGLKVAAKMKVTSAKILPSGKLRFGLFVPDKRSEARRMLEKIAGKTQRLQLKRLSGAA